MAAPRCWPCSGLPAPECGDSRWCGVKTEHAYPSRTALFRHKRKIGEILIGLGFLDEAEVEWALAERPAGMRIGEYLVMTGKISEDDLYDALSLQQSVPVGKLRAEEISNRVARSLPKQVIQGHKVLPYRIAEGNMFLASPEIPTDELSETLRGFTRMTPRYQLVTPANFGGVDAGCCRIPNYNRRMAERNR